MLNILRLGIVWKDGKIINHRSILKLIANPIMFQFGCFFGTQCDEKDQILGKVVLCKDDSVRGRNIFKDYWQHIMYAPKSYYDYVELRRVLI